MRLALASSVSETAYIDPYNLHADAGSLPDDVAARQANMAHVDVWSKGNAVVVAGDTNSRYSRGEDTGSRGFLAAGFKDAWFEVSAAGWCPRRGRSPCVRMRVGRGGARRWIRCW